MRAIWIIAETLPWAAVLAATAQQVDSGAAVTAFINGDEAAAKQVISFGASKAFALPLPANALWESYTPAVLEKIKAEKPALVLLSASKRCRDMAAQLSAALDAPCISDAKNLAFIDGGVTGEALMYGGMAVKSVSCKAETVFATVGAKACDPAAADASRSGDVASLANCTACPAKVTERRARVAQSVNLEDAVKVVSVGRGFSQEADLDVARQLAKALDAELACSRPIAEFFKWLPEEYYVGISGQIIKPQLYLAVGISGQAQHYYGMRDSKVIVSVNKDADALLNQNADYYIVGDWKDVIPALLKAVS